MRRTNAILLAAAVCSAVASCSQKETATPRSTASRGLDSEDGTPQKPPPTVACQEGENWTILTKEDISKQLGDDAFPGIWQPAGSDVLRAIQSTRGRLEKLGKTASSKRQNEKIQEVLDLGIDQFYACQALGYTKRGTKLIHLNFFPRSDIRLLKQTENEDWRHFYQAVVDGGALYWKIDFDPKTNTLSGFETNLDAGESYDGTPGPSSGVGGNLW
jgi:hypothetical protein